MQAISPEAASPIPSQYWQWEGHSVHYVQQGDRDLPALLLVHGFGASTDHWRKNIMGLKEHFSVWAIDLLGFGRSAKPPVEYSGKLWQNQLSDFIDQVIQKPVALAGNSLGGYASLCAAAHNPQVNGLILLNSAGPFSEPSGGSYQKKGGFSSLIGKVLNQPWASYLLFQYLRRPSTIRKTLNKVYLDRSAVTQQLVDDIYRPSCDEGAAQVFGSIFKSRQGEKVDQLLGKMSCPLLMLWGEGDPWIQARSRGEKFKQHYPTLTEHYLNAGHCPHDEIPDQVNQLITDWFCSSVVA